ncbi:MAG: quercetin dioxygenase-like cupin family protein [Cyclobacteriaceae bacterium]|jgi:quercetin dioxygenase-like cupin family protein
MKTSSLINDLKYNEDKPVISVLFETENSKEIRIAMRKGQSMKEHQTPFPIIIEIFDGEINFGVAEDFKILRKGDLISLDGGIPHNLKANVNSIVRLTLSKQDSAKRVSLVAKK